MSRPLLRYKVAQRALAEAKRVDEVKSIRDKAVAVQVYAKQAKDRTLIENATDIRMRAERRAGELLREMEKNKGTRGQTRGGRTVLPPQDKTPRLSDLGVTKTQSSRWQRFAAMEEPVFESRVVDPAKRKAVNVLDGAGRRTRQEMHAEDEARVKLLRPIEGRFRTLVIDPPWRSDRFGPTAQKQLSYATMTHKELLALPVSEWAEESCHLYLWVPNNFMPRACELMTAWGFEHKSVLTWRKPRWGLGEYFRNQTEHVLFGIRGELRTRVDNIPTIFDAALGEHSEKPEELYELIRKASYLPAGEAFQRKARDGFVNLYEPRVSVAAE